MALLDENIHPEKMIIKPGTKLVKPDSLVLPGVTAKNQVAIEKQLTADSGSIDFKPVPLIGQLDYYGSKNSDLITYCASYIQNFGKGLASVAGKEDEFKTIEEVLGEYHIPKELEYLAVIESALNKDARSPVGAVGYWQFMSGTARNLGLTVSRHRDDRKNLYKSTIAAAKYLTYLYSQLNDWLLVVAAYNCGAGRLQQAISNAKPGDVNFWSIKKYLPQETQNHVLAFISTATIMEKLGQYMRTGLPDNFNWASLNYSSNAKLATNSKQKEESNPLIKRFGLNEVKKMALIRINQPLNLQVLATVLDIDPHTVESWNYDYYSYQENYQSGETYNLRIPKDKLDTYIAKRAYIQSASDKMMN